MAKPKRIGIQMLELARGEIDRAISSRVPEYYEEHLRTAMKLLDLVMTEYEKETDGG